MRTLTLILALAILALCLIGACGCAITDVYGVGWHAHIMTVAKDVKLDNVRIVTRTPTTRQYLNAAEVEGNTRTDAITAANGLLGTIAGTVLKVMAMGTP